MRQAIFAAAAALGFVLGAGGAAQANPYGHHYGTKGLAPGWISFNLGFTVSHSGLQVGHWCPPQDCYGPQCYGGHQWYGGHHYAPQPMMYAPYHYAQGGYGGYGGYDASAYQHVATPALPPPTNGGNDKKNNGK